MNYRKSWKQKVKVNVLISIFSRVVCKMTSVSNCNYTLQQCLPSFRRIVYGYNNNDNHHHDDHHDNQEFKNVYYNKPIMYAYKV